jgi:hypothetical protein
LWAAIGRLLGAFTTDKCTNNFAAANRKPSQMAAALAANEANEALFEISSFW